MGQHQYIDILNKNLIPFAEENLSEDWIFQADNEPKLMFRKAKRFLEKHNVNVMRWPAQSPDLNLIEHFWNYVEKEVKMVKPSNLNNLYTVIENAWKNVSSDRCDHTY